MRSERCDIAILGGGCAGLSLAVKLAEAELGPRRVVVLEARERYERDRTWCGWSVQQHRFSGCVSHRWSRWRVRSSGTEVVQSSDSLAYEHIPADAFYREALAVISGSKGVELRMGTRIEEVVAAESGVTVATSEGTLEAELVVDTRPRRAEAAGTELLQHFEGWHVRTSAAVFDPGLVTLMDFDVPQERGLHFVYVLPFGPNEALVEATMITTRTLEPAQYEELLRSYIDERLSAVVDEVCWRERGVIPMSSGLPIQPRSRRILLAGGAAGAVKPSSGYGFLNIQRQTDALARELSGSSQPRPRQARGRVSDAMDRVFLDYLREHPGRAPSTFARLFESVAPEPLARFLMERASALDRLRIVAAMPKLPFLRIALAGRGSP